MRLIKETGCVCGKEHKAPTESIYIGSNIITDIGRFIEKYSAKSAFVILDENTYATAGEKVIAALENIGDKLHCSRKSP